MSANFERLHLRRCAVTFLTSLTQVDAVQCVCQMANIKWKSTRSHGTASAIWWIKQPMANNLAHRKRSMGTTFCHDFMDLFRNISLHGYSKMFSADFSAWERFIWFLVHLMTFVALIVVLTLTWEQFVAQYFVTNLKDPLYPVENVAFPAVSICTNNRISRQAAIAYAKQLNARDPFNKSIDFYMEQLKLLTIQYPRFQLINAEEEYVSFQSYLDSYGTGDNETFYNMRRHMTRLSPPCENIILKCWFGGRVIDCFGKNAFNMSLTMYGPCCTFKAGKNSRRIRYVGARGLAVLINASKADDHSTILNINGYVVLVHDADDYADVATGGAQQIFVSHGEQSILSLQPRVINADSAIRHFSPKSRKCLFPDESSTVDATFNTTYTFANCITRCRIRSIAALCRCLPFPMPTYLIINRDGLVYCTLSHLPCLLRYAFKWRSILTERKNIPGLEREMEDALFCPQCMPSCNDVKTKVSVLTLPLTSDDCNINVGEKSNETCTTNDISVLYVTFRDYRVKLYMRVLGNSWVEAFSTVGNILAIFMGFSMVAIFEIIYFICKYWLLLMKRLFQTAEINDENVNASDEPSKLYICP